jgi:hypothetical protein
MFRDWRYVLQGLLWLLLLLIVNTFVFGRGTSNVRLLIIYAVTTLILSGLGFFQKRDTPVRAGWRYLTPSAMEWFGLIASFGLTALFLYVYYFVGSARADEESQMLALKFLIVGFGGGTAIIFFSSFASELRWNDDCIEQRRLFRSRKTVRFADIVAGGLERWTQYVWVAGSDGTMIRFSPYQNGAEALARTLFKPEQDGSAAENP